MDEKPEGTTNVVREIPCGSRNRYEYDHVGGIRFDQHPFPAGVS